MRTSYGAALPPLPITKRFLLLKNIHFQHPIILQEEPKEALCPSCPDHKDRVYRWLDVIKPSYTESMHFGLQSLSEIMSFHQPNSSSVCSTFAATENHLGSLKRNANAQGTPGDSDPVGWDSWVLVFFQAPQVIPGSQS